MRGLHRLRAEVPFRRTDFSQPASFPQGKTVPSKPEPASRYIVVCKSDKVMADLLAYECSAETVGSDLHIRAKTRVELNSIVEMLQRNRIHGVLKRLSAS